ncbi:hypothetical protein BDZ88DRAFT_485026 [Geranomyces variabilis]|nr:hypothetical protein BDZ88DRAFT_485026 [Geranomyces variabilis]
MTGLPVEKRKVPEYVQNQLLKRILTAVGFAKYARCTSPEEARLRTLAVIGRFKEKLAQVSEASRSKASDHEQNHHFHGCVFGRQERRLGWRFWSQYMTMKKLRRSGREQMSSHIDEETAALLNDQPRQTETNITAIIVEGDNDDENIESDDERFASVFFSTSFFCPIAYYSEESAEANLRTLYLHMATKPLIRDGEDPIKHEKLFGLRRVLMDMYSQWTKVGDPLAVLYIEGLRLLSNGCKCRFLMPCFAFGGRDYLCALSALSSLQTWWRSRDIRTYSEAAVFAKLWGPIFDSWKARGYDMTAMDEPIPA